MDQEISQGSITTEEYLKIVLKKFLPVVKPGTQSRRFSHR